MTLTRKVSSKKKLLGIVASHRRLGNTEILVKVALEEARNAGLEVKLLRINDLKIETCRGCLKCMLSEKGCNIDDDMMFFLRQLVETDGIILGTPIFTYMPPAIIKLLMDRVYMIRSCYRDIIGKKAGILAVGAMPVNDCLTMPVNYLFLKVYLAEVVALQTIHNAFGPGSVLQNNDALEKARDLGRKVSSSVLIRDIHHDNTCPLCSNNIVKIQNGIISCPLCGRQGSLRNGDVSWKESVDRLNANFIIDYFSSWVYKTRTEFRKDLATISKRKKRFSDNVIKIEWLKPTL